MTKICFNVQGSNGGGGPSVFVYKTATELAKRGHSVTYKNPQKADAAVCIIETGKFLKYCKNSKTKVILRIDGIYNAEYNKKFNRAIRPDMASLHSKLTTDIPAVHHVVYQSSWSKDRIDDEIVKRNDNNWSVINNGVNVGWFKPIQSPDVRNKKLNLIHVGIMRNGYIMESLLGAYDELKKRGHNVSITLVGSMDAECRAVFSKYQNDANVVHKRKVPNSSLPAFYGTGDIYIGPRQGSSSDNVIAEAQACGLPVVVPSWGGNVDMVVDKSTGIVVPSGHWDYDTKYFNAIADGVEVIEKDLVEYKKRARKHAVQNLTIEGMVDKYLKIL
jgi:glycosyltransferase involved in cell wall biosynthesis